MRRLRHLREVPRCLAAAESHVSPPDRADCPFLRPARKAGARDRQRHRRPARGARALRGVGVDVSPAWSSWRASAIPSSRSSASAGEQLDLGRDVRLHRPLRPRARSSTTCSRSSRAVARTRMPRTRIVVNSYSQLWRPIAPARRAPSAEAAQADPQLGHAARTSCNLLELAGFEVVTRTRRILLPKRVPCCSTFLNGFSRTSGRSTTSASRYWIVARPPPQPLRR